MQILGSHTSLPLRIESTQTRQKEQLISHLEPKRQQNVGIFLQSFKNSISSIINAILQVDEELLTTEAIQRLCDNLPTQEEVRNLFAVQSLQSLTTFNRRTQ